ncbi:flavin reductase [Actinomadura sp. LD22]|uniref:Flavin reductase n=1 Tax=Actinomadura physcomitrii TaxID=2650748 RepID=A0A6I4M376_9ACTN|nr:flavin reductase family protein [Actinomadura physcomitrii]MVZ99911.1 flavin reductase [Actinomadura physcomitrii]
MVADDGAVSLAGSFREVMARVCTPVAVVAAMDGERPHGTTVSAFVSLSMNPPMALVSLDKGSDLLALLRPGRPFAINVLSRRQADLAAGFARKGTSKFEGVGWSRRMGVPRLTGSLGWLGCEVAEQVPGGDHVIVLGSVFEAVSEPGEPLIYHERAFGTYAALGGPVVAAR